MHGNVTLAFALTVFAGLSTGIGSAIALFAKSTSRRFLSISLGFSAGVMIYVSLVEIFPEANSELVHAWGENTGTWINVFAFLGGMLISLLIDRFVPEVENPHHMRTLRKDEDGVIQQPDEAKLMRMGMFAALAITIHNFPEGIASFTAALADPALGVTIAIAIAIHNIPEGVAVSVPIYYATGNRKKAFWLSFASGLAEPLGAVVGYLILRPFLSPGVFGIVFASTAGIMVFISLDELVPSAKEYGTGHDSIYGLIAGMGVMALSLLLMM